MDFGIKEVGPGRYCCNFPSQDKRELRGVMKKVQQMLKAFTKNMGMNSMKKCLFFLIVILFITSAFIQITDAHWQSSLLEKTRKSKLIILAKCIGTEPNSFFVADYKIIEVWKGDYFEKTIRIDYKKSYKKEFPPEPSPIKDEQVVLFLKDDLTLLPGLEGKLNIDDNNISLYRDAIKKFLILESLDGEEKILAIIKLIDDKNKYIKQNMLFKLHDIDKKTIAALEHNHNIRVLDSIIGVLKDPDPEVRRRAVNALRDMGDDERITRALIETFNDESADVRRDVIFALSLRNSKDATYLYYGAMEDKDPKVRRAGINAFERFVDLKAKPKILNALKDNSTIVRESALRTLCVYIRKRIIEPTDGINALVEPLLKDNDAFVRKEAKQYFFEVYSIKKLK